MKNASLAVLQRPFATPHSITIPKELTLQLAQLSKITHGRLCKHPVHRVSVSSVNYFKYFRRMKSCEAICRWSPGIHTCLSCMWSFLFWTFSVEFLSLSFSIAVSYKQKYRQTKHRSTCRSSSQHDLKIKLHLYLSRQSLNINQSLAVLKA